MYCYVLKLLFLITQIKLQRPSIKKSLTQHTFTVVPIVYFVLIAQSFNYFFIHFISWLSYEVVIRISVFYLSSSFFVINNFHLQKI